MRVLMIGYELSKINKAEKRSKWGIRIIEQTSQPRAVDVTSFGGGLSTNTSANTIPAKNDSSTATFQNPFLTFT